MRTLAADLRYSLRVLLRAPSFALAVVARARARHRRQHRHLQHRQRRAAAAAAVRRAGPAGAALPRAAAGDVPGHAPLLGLAGQLLRLAARRRSSFDGMALYRFRQFTLTGSGNAEARRRRRRRRGLLRGRRARSRRSAACSCPEEDSPGRGHVVVLSDGFWRSHFGARSRRRRPHADARRRGLHHRRRHAGALFDDGVGRHGTATSGCRWHTRTTERAVRDNHNDAVVARLKPGVTPRAGAGGDGRDLAAARARVSAGEHRLGRDGRAAAGIDRRRHPHVAGHAARRRSRSCC